MAHNSTQNNGITGSLDTTLPVAMSIGAFTAISWYNVLELNVMIWLTFRQRRGLYFYSLLAASWGIVFHQLGYIMRFFKVWKNDYVSETVVNLGWFAMVTGQSLVLYSRLHLVVRDHRRIRWILYMIITDFFILHIPNATLDFLLISNPTKFVPPFNVMERTQVTGFFVQEVIISGLYVYETRKLLKPAEAFQKGQIRRVMRHLIYINIFIIILDIVVLATEYANLFDIQVTFKGAVYSVKLRMEFAILNQLMLLAGGGARSSRMNSRSAYWLSSCGNETNRTEGRDIALNAFETTASHGAVVSSKGNEDGIGYTFSAGKGGSSQLSQTLTDRDKSHVVKTTEVIINSSNRGVTQMQRPHRSGDEMYETGRTENHMQRPANSDKESPASSEVEFAGRGY